MIQGVLWIVWFVLFVLLFGLFIYVLEKVADLQFDCLPIYFKSDTMSAVLFFCLQYKVFSI